MNRRLLRFEGHPSADLIRSQMLREEFFHRFVEFEAVLFVAKAVAFVVLDNLLDWDATFAQRFDHLIGLSLVDARVVGALHNEHRRFDAVGMQGR